MLILGYIVAAFLGYLLGSIPTGYLVARSKGINIQSVGSGNIGATNVFRILGVKAGILVLLTDAAKGWSAVFLAVHCIGSPMGYSDPVAREWLGVTGGVAAVLGHNYTVWLRFKGGKGIATSAGVLLALVPQALLVAAIVWGICLVTTRYMSIASIGGALCLPFAVWLLGYSASMTGITAFLGALAIYKHKANIQRLMAGTESRIGRKGPGTTEINK